MRHNATMRDYGDDAPFIYSHDFDIAWTVQDPFKK